MTSHHTLQESLSAEPEATVPLENCLDYFWEMGVPLENIPVSIRPPAVEMPLLKRLVDATFIPDPGIEALLRVAYQTIGREAIQAAFQEEEKAEAEI